MSTQYALSWLLIPITLAACSAPIAPTPEPGDDATAAPATASAANLQGAHSDRAGIGVRSLNMSVPVTIDARRSLAVTDDAILGQFSFQAVLDQLVAQANVPGLTSLQLFQQWWSTATTCPPADPRIGHFAYQCPRAEGQQATQNPFATPASDASYIPVGLFNRFDLAPADGSDCGEYRIVFARRSGVSNQLQRNLVIFEAVLPNPNPSQGLQGCMPVAQFWANLTQVNDVNQRAAQLKSFYFTGLPGFEPVFHVDHYGANGKGQIRTNQFMQFNWLLREFKLQKSATSLQVVPATVKVNPFGALFAAGSPQAEKPAFDNALVAAVPALAANDINAFNWTPDDSFNAAQSDEQSSTENNYVGAFAGTSALRTAIANKLVSIGSALTPDHIVARAQALSCAGCHQLSNGANLGGGISWPSSLNFAHVSEKTEQGPDGARHVLSAALTNVFLPHRAAVLSSFLPPVCVPSTCAQLGAQCGAIADGCGGTLSCGSCGAGATCQGNHCQCAPLTCSDMGNNCGLWSNGCGGTVNCGSCRFGWTCSDGTCIHLRKCPPGLHDCGDGRCVKFCM